MKSTWCHDVWAYKDCERGVSQRDVVQCYWGHVKDGSWHGAQWCWHNCPLEVPFGEAHKEGDLVVIDEIHYY